MLAAPSGSVLVAALHGAAHGHWGEILAVAAQRRGIAGLVIDGGVRDVEELARIGFPVFSRSVTVVGTAKSYPGDFEVPVWVGGIVVRNGDLIVGDADGVIALPADDASNIIIRADQRVRDEERILAAVRDGQSTVDLYGLSARRAAGRRDRCDQVGSR